MANNLYSIIEDDYILNYEQDIISSLFPQKYIIPLICAIFMKDWLPIWVVFTIYLWKNLIDLLI